MSRRFTVRLALREDLAGIVELAESIPEAPRWSLAMYREFITPTPDAIRRRVLMVAVNGEDLYGFAAATALETDAELESIAVSAEARRSGVGSALLESIVRWCAGEGANTLRLEVRAANVSAQAFYGTKGLREVGLRRGYYRMPDDDGVLMLREIGKPS